MIVGFLHNATITFLITNFAYSKRVQGNRQFVSIFMNPPYPRLGFKLLLFFNVVPFDFHELYLSNGSVFLRYLGNWLLELFQNSFVYHRYQLIMK